jgi:hypothetical protein
MIMMIQSLYNKTWTTWQLGKNVGYAVPSKVVGDFIKHCNSV